MKTRTVKGWLAPDKTESATARWLAEDIADIALYANKSECLTDDCVEGEKPVRVEIEIRVGEPEGAKE